MVLSLREGAPDWSDAKCAKPLGVPNEEYDIPFDQPTVQVEQCNGGDGRGVCPVRDRCLIFALKNNITEGVWGGMGEADRATMRRKYPLRKQTVREEWQWHAPSKSQRKKWAEGLQS